MTTAAPTDIEPSVSEAKTTLPDPDLDQAGIELRMVEALETLLKGPFEPSTWPRSAVTALLSLRGTKGRKLVFTRHDLFQIFAIQARKLTGEDRV